MLYSINSMLLSLYIVANHGTSNGYTTVLLLTSFFVSQVPTLMRATSDDESPCPGYLFEEIGSILFVALQKRVEYRRIMNALTSVDLDSHDI